MLPSFSGYYLGYISTPKLTNISYLLRNHSKLVWVIHFTWNWTTKDLNELFGGSQNRPVKRDSHWWFDIWPLLLPSNWYWTPKFLCKHCGDFQWLLLMYCRHEYLEKLEGRNIILALLFYCSLPPIGQKKILIIFLTKHVLKPENIFQILKENLYETHCVWKSRNKHSTPIVSEGFLFKTVNKKDKRNFFLNMNTNLGRTEM